MAHYRCSPKVVTHLIKKFFPILQWLPIYQLRQWLPGDIVAGVTTGMVCALQGKHVCLWFLNKMCMYCLKHFPFFPQAWPTHCWLVFLQCMDSMLLSSQSSPTLF